jgi:putative hydrolase of the HAD superfamily
VPLLADHGARVPAAAARQAVGAAYAAYRARWRLGQPYDARDAVETIVRELGVRLPGEGRRRLQALVEDPGRSHGLLPVVPAADVRDALLELRHSGVRLGIVSDTGLSPGRTLRAYLRDAGLAWLFEPAGLAFSDEIGSSKRGPAIFARALRGLGASAAGTVHVGDIRCSDVAGARGAGLGTIRYSGLYDDRDPRCPDADVVISSFSRLSAALRLLAGGPPQANGHAPAAVPDHTLHARRSRKEGSRSRRPPA